MDNTNLERLTWVLIYGGLLVLCLGIFVLRGAGGAPLTGWSLVGGGGLATAIGVALIWLRSRR